MEIKHVVILIVLLALISDNDSVELAPNVNSGMTLSEVEEVIGQGELKPFKRKKGMNFFHWKGTETFLIFRSPDNVLIYKIAVLKDSARSELMDYFVDEGFTDPIEYKEGSDKILILIKGRSTGAKIKDNTEEGLIQVWLGSIDLWNEHTEKHKSLVPFPKEIFNL